MLELVVRRARLSGIGSPAVDIGIEAGRIVAVAPRIDAECPELDAGDRLVLPGLVEALERGAAVRAGGPSPENCPCCIGGVDR